MKTYAHNASLPDGTNQRRVVVKDLSPGETPDRLQLAIERAIENDLIDLVVVVDLVNFWFVVPSQGVDASGRRPRGPYNVRIYDWGSTCDCERGRRQESQHLSTDCVHLGAVYCWLRWQQVDPTPLVDDAPLVVDPVAVGRMIADDFARRRRQQQQTGRQSPRFINAYDDLFN